MRKEKEKYAILYYGYYPESTHTLQILFDSIKQHI